MLKVIYQGEVDMAPRRCNRCGDGLVVERSDQYGDYLVCMSCGDTTYPGLGAPRGPGEEAGRNGLSRSARQVNIWRGTLYDRARKFPAPARCVWPDCHHCGDGKGCCARPASGLAYCQRHASAYRWEWGCGAAELGRDASAGALRHCRGRLLC